jgi:hypothetical protein
MPFKARALGIIAMFVVTSPYSKTPLAGLNGTTNHQDTQKIRIIEFFFANRLHWLFEVEINFYKRLF